MTSDDLGPVLNDAGEAVADDDVIALAERIETVEIRCDGLTYKARAQRGRVPYSLDERRNAVEFSLLLKAGYTDEDFKPGGALNLDGEGAEVEDDPRREKYLELRNSSDEFRTARAAIAAAATITTNVPQLRSVPELAAYHVLSLPRRLGDAYSAALLSFMRRSPQPPTAGAETKSAESTTKRSAPTPDSRTKAKSRATS